MRQNRTALGHEEMVPRGGVVDVGRDLRRKIPFHIAIDRRLHDAGQLGRAWCERIFRLLRRCGCVLHLMAHVQHRRWYLLLRDRLGGRWRRILHHAALFEILQLLLLSEQVRSQFRQLDCGLVDLGCWRLRGWLDLCRGVRLRLFQPGGPGGAVAERGRQGRPGAVEEPEGPTDERPPGDEEEHQQAPHTQPCDKGKGGAWTKGRVHGVLLARVWAAAGHDGQAASPGHSIVCRSPRVIVTTSAVSPVPTRNSTRAGSWSTITTLRY